MKKSILFLLLTTLLFGLLSADFEQKIYSSATIGDNFHGSRVLVVLDKNISDINKPHSAKLFGSFQKISIEDISQIHNPEVITVIEETLGREEFRQIFKITLPNDDKQNILNAISELEQIEGIRYAGPDHLLLPVVIPNDPYYTDGSLWGLNGTYGINAPQAWDVSTGSNNVRVGIMDTGIAPHVDLNANLTDGWSCVPPYYSTVDTQGHGTHVAGTVGAVGDNMEGVVGVNWTVKLVPMRIGVDGAQISDVLSAINWAIDNWGTNLQVSILNFSFSGYGEDIGIPIKDRVSHFPGLFVWAAGNGLFNFFPENLDLKPNIGEYHISNLISVGGIDSSGQFHFNYSLSGNNIDIHAPGVNIWSTYIIDPYYSDGGTSMATPHVTGVAALLLSVNSTLSAQQLKQIILNNSLPHTNVHVNGITLTNKRLDAFKSVSNIANMVSQRTDLFWRNSGPFSGGYNWVCFPVLNKFNMLSTQYYSGTFYNLYADDLYLNLHIYNNNNLFSLRPEILSEMKWRYNTDIVTVDPSTIFDIDPHRLDSRYGYKIKVNEPYDTTVMLNGFLAGYLGNSNVRMTIQAKSPLAAYRETWVGYFKTISYDPLIALSGIQAHLVEIKTQRWALNRASVNVPWPPYLASTRINYGEAVSLKYVGDVDRTFTWNPRTRSSDEQEDEFNFYVHAMPVHFSYVELDDYTPIYVELSDNMIGDNIGEIALYIDDVCYGAEVLTGVDLVQINAYINDDICLDTAQIEIRFHEYTATRGHSITQYVDTRFQAINLTSDPNKIFYTVSLKDEVPEIVTNTQITSLEGNYPNPFNPSTTIKYSLAQNDNVKLQVFNIKGQVVRTLVNANQDAGFHSVVWNGVDNNNTSVASGIYFYRLETNTTKEVKRMLLMK